LVSSHQRDVTAPRVYHPGPPIRAAAELRERQSVESTHMNSGEAAEEAAMPLIYVPLIMYASWMEFLAQPFRATTSEPDKEMLAAAASIHRSARRK
jgi:hypothetical protein